MPFTFSHPAAIIPAKILPRRWISLTALVIGSITPDFEYFIRMKNLGLYGHTFAGIFWFDLPIALALTYVYHLMVRDSLIDNLPRFLRSRLTRFKQFNWPAYARENIWVVLVCLVVGISSHLFWDAFTHRTGYFVNRIPWLLANTEVFGVEHVRFYILQNISSLVGMICVIVAILSMPRDIDTEKRSIIKYWLIAGLITITITAIRFVVYSFKPTDEIFVVDKYRIPEDIIMTAISAVLIALVITPFILKRTA